MKTFCLTYSTVTEESAANGDHEWHGFIDESEDIPQAINTPDKPAEFRLRDAIRILLDRESQGPVEADSCPISRTNPPRWFNYGGSLDWHNGTWTTVSMHCPKGLSPSSRMRIARLLRCYGTRA